MYTFMDCDVVYNPYICKRLCSKKPIHL